MKTLTVGLFMLAVLVTGLQAQGFLSALNGLKDFDFSKLRSKSNFAKVFAEFSTKSYEVISEENPKVAKSLTGKFEELFLQVQEIMSDDSDGLTKLEKRARLQQELWPQGIAVAADFMRLSRRTQLKVGRLFLDNIRKSLDNSLNALDDILAEEEAKLDVGKIDQDELLNERQYSEEL